MYACLVRKIKQFSFFVNLQTKKDLENCMDQWKEFDSWYERCNSWLKEVEAKVKDTELKAALKDKQNQLDKLKKLQEELTSRQGDIDTLSDAAQDLVRISTDTRVISQSSQLATKFQTLRVNIKVGQTLNPFPHTTNLQSLKTFRQKHGKSP